MIASVSGRVLSVTAGAAVVEVGGVGMQVLGTPGALAELHVGQQVTMHTHLVVREDSLTLFGFPTAAERHTFEALQSVSGVGPRLALAMLAVHSPDALATAVAAGDRAALEKVPGIGAKVAARLLLELGGKLSLPDVAAPAREPDARDQVVEGLVGLGWPAKAAQQAVDAVAPDPIAAPDVSATLRDALKQLGGTRG